MNSPDYFCSRCRKPQTGHHHIVPPNRGHFCAECAEEMQYERIQPSSYYRDKNENEDKHTDEGEPTKQTTYMVVCTDIGTIHSDRINWRVFVSGLTRERAEEHRRLLTIAWRQRAIVVEEPQPILRPTETQKWNVYIPIMSGIAIQVDATNEAHAIIVADDTINRATYDILTEHADEIRASFAIDDSNAWSASEADE